MSAAYSRASGIMSEHDARLQALTIAKVELMDKPICGGYWANLLISGYISRD